MSRTNNINTSWSFQTMSSRQRISRTAYFCLIVFALSVSTICLVNAISWINKPFPGFLLNQRNAVGFNNLQHWNGVQAGVHYPDRLIAVNGRNIESTVELEKIVAESEEGEPLSYIFERERETFAIPIATMRFSIKDFFLIYGINALIGFLYLLIGAIVYFLKPDGKVSLIFFSACFLNGLLMMLSFDAESTHYGFVWLQQLSAAFLPACLCHLSLLFPEQLKISKEKPKIAIVPYVISFILYSAVFTLYPDPSFINFFVVILVYTNIGVVAFILSSMVSYFRNSSSLARQRARVILWGTFLALPIPALSNLLRAIGGEWLVVFNQVFANFADIPILIFPACIAYAITKHNLFDVDVFIKRALGYALMTTLVGVGYLGTQVIIESFVLVPLFGSNAQRIYPVFFAFLIVVLFNPINQKLQGWIDRLFYRTKFDYKNTVASVSNALTTVFNLEEVLHKIISTVKQEMFIDRVGLIVLAEGDHADQFYFSGNPETIDFVQNTIRIDSDAPLISLLAKNKKLITRYDIEEDPKYANIKEGCEKRFEEIGATLAVPLVYQDSLIGVMSLGTKKSGHFYSRDDISLIETLASQSAIAIKNAKLFEDNIEKTRMEEELKIAHDIQTAMLPKKLPELEEVTFTAISFPAQEVGGDFFDFIEKGDASSGNRKVDIIVADVSGKAVSGALVMAASRSVFRLLAEDEGSVSQIARRANVRLKHDIKKGMFVALVYASLNPVDRTLTLVNAGQAQPILLPRSGSKPHFIENSGDTFPLGIIDDCDYKEISIQLATGDSVIFYTDGIVEAMSEDGEMYGFDRFMEVIEKNRNTGVDFLHAKIMTDIIDFVGNAEQHDDLTLVIFQVN